jgi:hypothetical protein
MVVNYAVHAASIGARICVVTVDQIIVTFPMVANLDGG